MLPEIQNRFTSEILQACLETFGIEESTIQDLGGFESFIFGYSKDGQDAILRIGHDRRRNRKLVLGEMEFLDYLAKAGADVCLPIQSPGRNWVETHPDGHGEAFVTSSFSKAQGRPPQPEDWTAAFVEAYGVAVGKLHQLTQGFQPTPDYRRFDWDDPLMLDTEASLPSSEGKVVEILHQTRGTIHSFPQCPSSFGLIHQDAHRGNFFVTEEGKFTFFDFDDCCYGHFAYDVAIVLFYAVAQEDSPEEYAGWFLKHFFQGYQRHNEFRAEWLSWLPAFLKLREIDIYGVIHRSRDVTQLEHPFEVAFMEGRKERIEAGKPFLNMDFRSLE